MERLPFPLKGLVMLVGCLIVLTAVMQAPSGEAAPRLAAGPLADVAGPRPKVVRLGLRAALSQAVLANADLRRAGIDKEVLVRSR